MVEQECLHVELLDVLVNILYELYLLFVHQDVEFVVQVGTAFVHLCQVGLVKAAFLFVDESLVNPCLLLDLHDLHANVLFTCNFLHIVVLDHLELCRGRLEIFDSLQKAVNVSLSLFDRIFVIIDLASKQFLGFLQFFDSVSILDSGVKFPNVFLEEF